MDDLFLDTAYAIALSSVTDEYHSIALKMAVDLESGGTRLITTRAILLEIGNSLSKLRFRSAAASLLEALEEDPGVEIVEVTLSLYQRALRLFGERLDKEWSLTDCISFVVMADRRLTQALTTDHHYEQAGFQILLKSP